MSQTTLGDKTGITFQQIQKYENGKNCVSASRLQQVANVLMVTLDFFFDGGLVKAPNNSGRSETQSSLMSLSARGMVCFSEGIRKIRNAKTRRRVRSLVEQLVRR